MIGPVCVGEVEHPCGRARLVLVQEARERVCVCGVSYHSKGMRAVDSENSG